jgi:hypothetical protein
LFILGLGAVGCVLARRAVTAPRKSVLSDAFALCSLSVVTFVGWQAAGDPAFFHMNGHGPRWIQYALGHLHESGPGFFELFGWVALNRPEAPDSAVFLLQAGLGALWPASVWVLVRAVGGSRSLAWAAAIALAVNPLFGRVTHSESYLAAINSLLLLGGVALVVGIHRNRDRLSIALAVLAAGLMVSQAARIHPLAWLPSATLPLVVLVGPGGLRRRLILTATACVGIGGTVLLLTGGSLFDLLETSMAADTLQHKPWTEAWERISSSLPILLPVTLGFAVIAKDRQAGLVNAGVVLGLGVLMVGADLIVEPAAAQLANLGLYLAPLAAVVAAGLSTWPRTPRQNRVTAGLLLGVGLFANVAGWSEYRILPTDALEQNEVIAWREQLPANAEVIYLGRVGERVQVMPLYGEHVEATPSGRGVDVDELPLLRPSTSGTTFYLESSLCSTRAGTTACADFRALHVLEPVVSTTLPARESRAGEPYLGDEVAIGLYRISR